MPPAQNQILKLFNCSRTISMTKPFSYFNLSGNRFYTTLWEETTTLTTVHVSTRQLVSGVIVLEKNG